MGTKYAIWGNVTWAVGMGWLSEHRIVHMLAAASIDFLFETIPLSRRERTSQCNESRVKTM